MQPKTAQSKTAKKFAKDLLKNCRRAYINTFRSFDPQALAGGLRNLGVERGDTLMVHCAYDAFQGFTGKPLDVIAILEELVGAEGTILMPSMPFTGTAIDYVRSGAVTDISRTPSRMGLISELFRRQQGTIRSISATHPVLARGARAAAMVSGHENAASPCGAGSPYARLLEVNGKSLLLGTSIETMTFFHYLEEEFEQRLPVSPLTSEFFTAEVRAGGRSLQVRTRLFEPRLSRRRRISTMLPELQRLKGISTARIGVVPVSLIRAAAARGAFEGIVNKGLSFYHE